MTDGAGCYRRPPPLVMQGFLGERGDCDRRGRKAAVPPRVTSPVEAATKIIKSLLKVASYSPGAVKQTFFKCFTVHLLCKTATAL